MLALVAALWAPRLGGPIDLHYDGAVYYVLGTSLAEGHGYRLANEPGEIEALQYPPLFALFIAAHEWLLGSTDPAVVAPALRLSHAVLSLAYGAALLALAARFLPLGFALLATLLCTLSFRTVYLSELLFPELSFALVSVLFFLAAGARDRRARLAAGPLAIAAYLLRSAGVALLAAWVLDALLVRAWKAAAVRAALCALPVLAWQVHGARVEASAAYAHPAYPYQRAPYLYNNVSYGRNLFLVDPFAPEHGAVDTLGLARRWCSNASHLPVFVGEILTTPSLEWSWGIVHLGQLVGLWLHPSGVVPIALAALGLAAAVGLVLMARRGERVIPLYVACSLALISLTPWLNQFWRYLAPLSPFLAIAFACALWRAKVAFERRRPGSRAAHVAIVLLGATILVGQAWMIRTMFTKNRGATTLFTPSGTVSGAAFFLEGEWKAFDAAVAWLRAHAAPEAVIASSSPHLVYLETDRKAVMPPLELDPVAAQTALDAVPVTYLLVDDLSFSSVPRRYVRPLVEARPELWEPVFRAGGESQLTIWKRR